MTKTKKSSSKVLVSLTKLDEKVHQAVALIEKLKEGDDRSSARDANTSPSEDEGLRAEIESLREERETIRTKVIHLLGRIEKLES